MTTTPALEQQASSGYALNARLPGAKMTRTPLAGEAMMTAEQLAEPIVARVPIEAAAQLRVLSRPDRSDAIRSGRERQGGGSVAREGAS